MSYYRAEQLLLELNLPGGTNNQTQPTSSSACPTLPLPIGTQQTDVAAANYGTSFPGPSFNSQPRKRTKILIVDDSPISASGIRHVLGAMPDFMVCETAISESEISAIFQSGADALVYNLATRSFDLLKTITTRSKIPVLTLGRDNSLADGERALLAGAMGYVGKSGFTTEVVPALRQVLRGGLSVPEELEQKLILMAVNGESLSSRSPNSLLSNRQASVFQLLGEGLGTRQIAERLSLSIKTIEQHRSNIMAKLHFKNAVEMVHAAILWVFESKTGNGKSRNADSPDFVSPFYRTAILHA